MGRKWKAVSVGRVELEALGGLAGDVPGGDGAPDGAPGGVPGGGGVPDGVPGGVPDGAPGGVPDGVPGDEPDGAPGGVPDGRTGEEGVPDVAPGGGVVYGDWEVCRALGWRRRKLAALRKTLRRGVDWDVADGEVGMTGAWCRAKGLAVEKLARAGGRVSVEVVGFVPNRQLVLARAFGTGVVGPARVRDAGDFRRGDVFETEGGRIVGPWPRRDW